MKRSKLLVLALVAVLMTVGLVLAGCRIGCEGAGTCESKKGGSLYSGGRTGSTCTNDKCIVNNKLEAKCDC
jgi:hypothetical protein